MLRPVRVIDLYGLQCGILFIVSDVFGIFSNKWLVRETDREAQEIEKIRDTRGDFIIMLVKMTVNLIEMTATYYLKI